MALNFPAANGFWSSISALNEDILVHNLLLSHVPDGRWLDSEMLLQEVENIMRIVLENEVSGPPMGSETQHRISNIEIVESTETLPYAISRISLPMLCPSTGEKDLETRTMVLFDLLQNYRWDAKVVIVLGALAATYGGLWLPKHLSSSDPVAASVATLSWLPFNRSKFSPWLKSLSLLVKAMLDVTKCIITFERLPVRHAKPDKNVVGETMSQVHLAAYWVVRSALACLLQIHDFKQSQQVHVIPPFHCPLSTRWAEEEKGIFEFFSNSLPWCSVRRPWLMSSTVVKFMRTIFNCQRRRALGRRWMVHAALA